MLPKADGKERLPFGVTEGTNFYDWKDRDNFLSVRNAELSRYTADQSGCVSQYFCFLRRYERNLRSTLCRLRRSPV